MKWPGVLAIVALIGLGGWLQRGPRVCALPVKPPRVPTVMSSPARSAAAVPGDTTPRPTPPQPR